MSSNRDFIPGNWNAFAGWLANFNTQLQILSAKYGVAAGKIAATGKDNDWVQYWIEAKVTAKAQEKQLGDYIAESPTATSVRRSRASRRGVCRPMFRRLPRPA